MKEAILNPKGLRRALSGGLWFFRGDFGQLPVFEAGELGKILTPERQFWGLAYFNPKSSIIARLLTRKEETIDYTFFRACFEKALALRRSLYPGEEAFRLIHGEGDLLPGLTVDLYGHIAVIQLSTAGMERLKSEILKALKELIPLKGFVFRNDLPAREEEGLPLYVEAEGVSGPLEIVCDGLRFLVDPVGGQKTGFFLDQRENRRRITRYVQGKVVLDLFCYTGAFALYAAKAGAAKVLAVDRSKEALKIAEENARLNGLSEKIQFVQDEVERFLRYAPRAEALILDPPALIKKKKAYQRGKRRYRELIQRAFKTVKEGGVLLVCSCSQFLSLEDLIKICREEGLKTEQNTSLLEIGLQALDHPVYLPMPETFYLKGLFLRIL